MTGSAMVSSFVLVSLLQLELIYVVKTFPAQSSFHYLLSLPSQKNSHHILDLNKFYPIIDWEFLQESGLILEFCIKRKCLMYSLKNIPQNINCKQLFRKCRHDNALT